MASGIHFAGRRVRRSAFTPTFRPTFRPTSVRFLHADEDRIVRRIVAELRHGGKILPVSLTVEQIVNPPAPVYP